MIPHLSPDPRLQRFGRPAEIILPCEVRGAQETGRNRRKWLNLACIKIPMPWQVENLLLR